MKKFGYALSLTSLLVTLSLHANTTITLDENGNETGLPTGGQYILGLDSKGFASVPATGLTTLDYLYPVLGTSLDHVQDGWVVVDDHDGSVSDLIHFDNELFYPTGSSNEYQQIFFYSSDPGSDLADVFPGTAELAKILADSKTVTVSETSLGVATYTPVFGEAGDHVINVNGSEVAATPAYTYKFQSDGVPDTAQTLSLLAGACGLLLALSRFRQEQPSLPD